MVLVGASSKNRKQSFDVKKHKQQSKLQKTQPSDDDDSICTKCKQKGHKSPRSYLCLHNIMSKAQAIHASLGDNYKAYTRRLAFDNCVSETNHTRLKSSVIKACSTVRYLVFKAKLFVSYYILNKLNIVVPKFMFSQNFWYTAIQVVNEQDPLKKQKKSLCWVYRTIQRFQKLISVFCEY